MFGLIVKGTLPWLVSLIFWCCCAGPTTHASSIHRHRLSPACNVPQSVRDFLAYKLSFLQERMEPRLSEGDMNMAAGIDRNTAFSHDSSMSSLTQGLRDVVSNLRCMGRALNICCHPHSRCSCLGEVLFNRHMMTDDVAHLSSQGTFQEYYGDVLRSFQQLRLAVGDRSGNAGTEEGCRSWRDSAQALTLSSVSVTIAQTLLTKVNELC